MKGLSIYPWPLWVYPSHNGSSAAVIVRPDGLLGYSCLHEECQDKHWRDFRNYTSRLPRTQRTVSRNHNNGHKLINTNLNDTANAEYLANLYGSTLRYDHRRARWLKWSGHRWQPDNNGEIYRFAIASARDRYRSASNITDLKSANVSLIGLLALKIVQDWNPR